MTNKTYPKVGDHLYLSTLSGDFYGDLVRRPYTVVEVNKGIIKVQKCQLIFNGPRYYNTMADDIKEDKNGKIEELTWKGRDRDYPQYAFFGEWDYYPYLN